MLGQGEATALRAVAGAPDGFGVRLVSPVEIAYRDGSEDALLARVAGAPLGDLAAASDALSRGAANWAEYYHLSPARGNVLRPFALNADMRVLEVGCGCGAVTRTIGETGATVDALEPVVSRARVARARTRDLPNVHVFSGLVEDLPAEASYDVVVVIGVLEYVGGGSADLGPYVEWLGRLRALLRPGGALILAIENQLGVKYLAGAPEDHSDRAFDSVEGYPWPSPARTFSHRGLGDLLDSAGFTDAQLYGAFPDYKMPRAVFAPGQPASVQSDVFSRLPVFPSPDWVSPRPKVADEQRLWRSLTAAGLSDDFPNSFIAVAHVPGGDPLRLWPEGAAAVYFADHHRASSFSFTAVVGADELGLRVDRRGWAVGDAMAGWLLHEPAGGPWISGRDLVDVVAEADDAQIAGLLARWVELLEAAALERPEWVPFDLVPHNCVLDADGELHAIDVEWWSRRHTLDDVISRGCFYLADKASATAAGALRWQGRSVAEVAHELEALARGKQRPWSATWVDREGDVQEIAAGVDWTDARASVVEAGERVIDSSEFERRSSGLVVYARRDADVMQSLAARASDLEAELVRTRDALGASENARDEAEGHLAAVLASRSYRASRSLSAAVRRVIPARSPGE